MSFLRVGEGRIYLKGRVSGDLSGIVEGYLTESMPESGIYDQYQAVWKIAELKGEVMSFTINLSGPITYQESTEYPLTELYVLQSCIEGTTFGHYTGPLSTVLTHLRISSPANPYYGEGFSIISYVSNIGQGEAWAYNNLTSPNISELKGISTGPLLGILSGKLNESVSPRTLTLTVERIDIGLPPGPDLKVMVWGPGRVSPGQTINYIIEYRNDGLKSADEVVIFYSLDSLMRYISASVGANYDEFFNSVDWNLGNVPPKTVGNLSIRVELTWGLTQGTTLATSAYIVDVSTEQSTSQIQSGEASSEGCSSNLFVNGINLREGNGWKKCNEFAKSHNAVWVPVYYGYTEFGPLKPLLDATQVEMATPGGPRFVRDLLLQISTQLCNVVLKPVVCAVVIEPLLELVTANLDKEILPTEYNGLVQPLITEHCYNNCYGYSGGTRTLLTALRYYNLRCKNLVLISPMSGIQDFGAYKLEIEGILSRGRVDNIYFYQSDKDLISGQLASWLFQVKFRPDDEPWLIQHNILVNSDTLPDGTKIENIDKINEQGHGGIFRFINNKGSQQTSSTASSIIAVARDPNRKLGPDGRVLPGQTLNYMVEYENEGEGIAFGVYFTDTLDEDLDDSTLQIGPVIDVHTGAQIAPPGTYNPATRNITWFVGEVGSGQGGYADFSVNVKGDATEGTEIINFATVYFPSVPEATRTNGVVSIVSYNRPPVANAGPDQTVEQASYAGTEVTLDGSGSTDLDSTPGTNDDIVSFDWYEGTALLGSGQTLNHTFPLGSHTVTLKVTDTFGESDTDEVVIVVQDTTPPQFTLSVSPAILWPPTHKMVLITPSWTVSDKCDPSPQVSLVNIVMNEGDTTNAYDPAYDDSTGDGRTTNDIQVGSNGSIYLRSERSGTGAGRIYTITYKAVDFSGNVTTKSATVTVPHDQR